VSFGLIIVALIALFQRQWIILALAVLSILSMQLLLRVRDRNHRHTGNKIATTLGWQRQKYAGANLYRPGPLGVDRLGKRRLPGRAANAELLEVEESYDGAVGVARNPARRH